MMNHSKKAKGAAGVRAKRVPKMRLRRGDVVRVVAGNDKGKQGKILRVFPAGCRALVEGIRLMTKHVKPSAANPKGRVDKKENPIHISNLMLLDPKDGVPTRVGRRRGSQGKLQRVAKKSDQVIVDDVPA